MDTQRLERLHAIAHSLQHDGRALALLGLGSAGIEQERLDAFSDLDFFVIAAPGRKQELIATLDWLERIRPLVWHYRNTVDGHKALFDDAIFCEFAVFEAEELPRIAFSPGRLIWHHPDFDTASCQPRLAEASGARDADWLLNEALGNLFVGLGRFCRGERLSAFRLVQLAAPDCLLQLADRLAPASDGVSRDRFAIERRFEARQPDAAAALPDWMRGYDASPASALAQLDWLERHFAVNPPLAAQIRALAAHAPA